MSTCPLCGENVERWEGEGPWIHSDPDNLSLWCEDGRRGCDAIEGR